jgi:hypothetical protein
MFKNYNTLLVMEVLILMLRKSSLIVLALIGFLCCSVTVSAISDGTGDIWHWTATEGGFNWVAYTESNDKIDITNLDYAIEGSEVTMTMTVAGQIEDADTVYYLMHLLMGNDYYMATYLNGNGLVIGSGALSGFFEQLTDPVSGNTFTATFTVNDPTADYEIRGYAQELSTYGDETNAEWWGDWAPDTYFNEYTGYQGPGDDTDDDTEGEGTNGEDETDNGDTTPTPQTPGFEIILISIAFIIALIIRKRK